MPVAMSLADARLKRRIETARRGRDLTTQERETLERIVEGIPMPAGPIAMLPVAQLYVRDVPGLRPPAGADLVQVLWCPFDHDSDSGAAGMPRTALFWRSADAVTDILVDPPEPAAVLFGGDYVLEPCTIDPEHIIEYPSESELDDEQARPAEGVELAEEGDWSMAELEDWTMPELADQELDDGHSDNDYQYDDLCIAPGWKVGGWIRWGANDPYPQPCPACGARTEPFLTIASSEWHTNVGHWIPYEDQAAGMTDTSDARQPTRVRVGGGSYDQIISVCPASPDHPHTLLLQ
ncbi:hypothetical protein ACIA5H_08265 [Nocardia sp. NPDC051900]|uniref:hypothetical protein n=1 Tax=Nocardia sp. NPDC051900 TaxID=3364326 RepID=UPI003787C04B